MASVLAQDYEKSYEVRETHLVLNILCMRKILFSQSVIGRREEDLEV